MRLACITPLKEEARAVWRGWSLQPTGELRGRPTASDGTAFAIASGLGAARVRDAVELVRRLYDPDCLVLCGFCCGLSEELEPGALLLDSRTDAQLQRAVEELGMPIRTTRIETIPLLRTASDKHEFLAGSPGVLAGDMETEAFFEALGDKPGLALRAVSDGLDQELPFDFQAFLDDRGFPSPSAVALAALRAPAALPSLLSLASGSRKAEKALERASRELSLLLREAYPVRC